MSGEDLYAWARVIPHQTIPDYNLDRRYLMLLGRAAEANYAPAQAKLGEYAMRRGTWVEAYYWMSRAKDNGMTGLDDILNDICRQWVHAGCPSQKRNVHRLFSAEDGARGLELLKAQTGQP